jgi:nitroimidazol reductase NimA-like FMN-containing flavoprotein (pyridoxamine 5'-phosphate oxidase superfamily)
VNYAYLPGEIFIYTTEGKKTDFIDENPNICLQVEDVKSNSDWQSVVVTGSASRITDLDERERVVELLANRNPTFTPAVSIHWIDDWVRENHEVVYRVEVLSATGRKSAGSSPGLARRSTT